MNYIPKLQARVIIGKENLYSKQINTNPTAPFSLILKWGVYRNDIK